MNTIQPTLIEPGVKTFLSHTLKQCRMYKEKSTNVLYNVSLLISFMLFIGGILIYKYKGKLTPYQKEERDRQKKEYIISKLQRINNAKNRRNLNLITDLPNWDNHPELNVLNRKLYK